MIYKNPLAQHQIICDKYKAYRHDCNRGVCAYKSDNTSVPLRDVKLNNVEFIGGLWRVQNDFPYQISTVRGRDVIIGEKLQHSEPTFFEYFRGAFVAYNCYGPLKPMFDRVLGRYVTDNGTYWAYGATIPDARAFLAVKMYDLHKNEIHAKECRKKLSRTK